VPAQTRRAATAPRTRANQSSPAKPLQRALKKAARKVASALSKALEPKTAVRKRPAAKKAPAKKVTSQKTAAPRAAAPRARKGKLRGDAAAVLARFERAIPRPHVELAFQEPWQLLVATILSAQSTDRTVNRITPLLFERWPTPAALAAADVDEVEALIKPTGFFRNKTKSIRGASQMLVERFGGLVPRTMPELLEVPGVARKTANVVLGAAYGIASGIVTDTHAMRVSQRLELTREETPEKIEADLCRQFPQSSWIAMSHRLVLHGRHLCVARAPECPRCPLNEICPSRQAPPQGSWEQRADDEAADLTQKAEGFTHPRDAAT
jgi:endonuclease-3